MFPFNIITWFKIAVIATALAFSYWKGYSGEHEKFLKFKAEVEAVGKAQELANQSAAEMAAVITEGVKNEYEARIAALRNYYPSRVQSNSSSGNLPAVSGSTARVDESARDTVPAGQCAEVTQQLVSLQKWVERQSENVGK
jgi:hypothetical protein